MKELKSKKHLMGILYLFVSMALLSSCSEDKKEYMEFNISYDSQSKKIASQELFNYIETSLYEFNAAEFSSIIEKEDAKSKFDRFCSSVVSGAKEKKLKVFDGESITFTLSNILKNVVSERNVTFEQTATRQRYSTLVFKEIAPAGEVERVSEIIKAQLAPYSLVKESKVENDYAVNYYSLTKTFNSQAEMESDYAYQHYSDLSKLLSNIEKALPSDLIYTGALELVYSSVSEFSGENNPSLNVYSVLHKPTMTTGTWKSIDANAPFASIKFSNKAQSTVPVFITYNMTADGNLFDGSVSQFGFGFVVFDNAWKSKYSFMFKTADSFYLYKQDNVEVSNGAVYTRE